jgi:hypothetical protein
LTSIQNPQLEKAYNAKTPEQSKAAYDERRADYFWDARRCASGPAYPVTMAEHEDADRWAKVFETEAFASMPIGEPEIINKIFVYRIT